jgi:hypothetical protein
MSENPILMTQAEYARHRNKSPQYIGKLYKAGILVMRGRMVDAAASDAVLDDKPSEKTTVDGQPPASYAQARLADMVFRAKLRRLEFDTRQGKLVEATVVKERWAATGARGRSSGPAGRPAAPTGPRCGRVRRGPRPESTCYFQYRSGRVAQALSPAPGVSTFLGEM